MTTTVQFGGPRTGVIVDASANGFAGITNADYGTIFTNGNSNTAIVVQLPVIANGAGNTVAPGFRFSTSCMNGKGFTLQGAANQHLVGSTPFGEGPSAASVTDGDGAEWIASGDLGGGIHRWQMSASNGKWGIPLQTDSRFAYMYDGDMLGNYFPQTWSRPTWNASPQGPTKDPTANVVAYYGCAYSHDRSLFVIGMATGGGVGYTFQVWRTLDWTMITEIAIAGQAAYFAFSPDGTKLIAASKGSGGPFVRAVYDTSNWSATPTATANSPSDVMATSWSPDGTKLVVAGETSIHVYNGANLAVLTLAANTPASGIVDLAWSTDSTKLFVASSYEDLWIYNTTTWVPTSVAPSVGHGGSPGDPLSSVAVAPDGLSTFVASPAFGIIQLDANNVFVTSLPAMGSPIQAVRVTPDGLHLIVGFQGTASGASPPSTIAYGDITGFSGWVGLLGKFGGMPYTVGGGGPFIDPNCMALC